MELKDKTLLRSKCYINGEWVGEGGLDVGNPATGELITSVPRFGADETRTAIEAAAAAMPEWAAKTAKERAAILRRWFELQMENQEDLAQIMTAEQGKPLVESRGEVAYAASFIEFFAEEGKRIYGEMIPTHKSDARILVARQPVGVVAAITPWNFPLAMITRKLGPALAAGCTAVAKPASETPLSAFALAELGERAGIPAGVLNVISGSAKEIGGEITSNPTVRVMTVMASRTVDPADDGEESASGTRRQCSIHRFRRRRSRCRRTGRDGFEIPQCRPDLRVRQPHPGAGWGL